MIQDKHKGKLVMAFNNTLKAHQPRGSVGCQGEHITVLCNDD